MLGVRSHKQTKEITMIKRLECAFAEVYFIYGVGSDKISKELNKVFTKGHNYQDDTGNSAGKAFTMMNNYGDKLFFFWVDSNLKKVDLVSAIVHELVHIITFISDYIGTKMNDSSGEWVAYLQEDLLKQALLIINKKNHVKSKKAKKSTK